MSAPAKKGKLVERRLRHILQKDEAKALLLTPEEAAGIADLHHTSDKEPGLRRTRKGRNFLYTDAHGKKITDASTLKRIQSLVLPPAWKDVWISLDPAGHLQATGRDAKGRKQYRYHPLWRSVRDSTKYHRMVPFGESLPVIRTTVEKHLRMHGLGREKVLATVVRLLEETLIRIGNEEYARENESYGLTTMHDEHVRIFGSQIRFHFRGKSGKMHDLEVTDRRVATVVRQCRDLPGYEIFQYLDQEGNQHSIRAEHVNEYLQQITGEEFTAKDFRTWAATVQAALTLQACPPCDSEAAAKRNVVSAIKHVADALGNTPTICRKCYVHPFIVDAYLSDTLPSLLKNHLDRAKRKPLTGLTFGEAAVLSLLQECFDDHGNGN